MVSLAPSALAQNIFKTHKFDIRATNDSYAVKRFKTGAKPREKITWPLVGGWWSGRGVFWLFMGEEVFQNPRGSCDCLVQKMMHAFTAQRISCVDISCIVIIVVAWKARRLRDGFYIREELIYSSIFILLSVVAVSIAVSIPSIPSLSVMFFILNVFSNAIFMYPVAKTFGRTYHPYYPWTWCCCISKAETQTLESSRRDKELLEVLTSDRVDCKVSNACLK